MAKVATTILIIPVRPETTLQCTHTHTHTHTILYMLEKATPKTRFLVLYTSGRAIHLTDDRVKNTTILITQSRLGYCRCATITSTKLRNPLSAGVQNHSQLRG